MLSNKVLCSTIYVSKDVGLCSPHNLHQKDHMRISIGLTVDLPGWGLISFQFLFSWCCVRTADSDVITQTPRNFSHPFFLTHGAPCAWRSAKSRIKLLLCKETLQHFAWFCLVRCPISLGFSFFHSFAKIFCNETTILLGLAVYEMITTESGIIVLLIG